MNRIDEVWLFLSRWGVESEARSIINKYQTTMTEILNNGRSDLLVCARRDLFAAANRAGAPKSTIGRAFQKSVDIVHYAIGGDGRRAKRFPPVYESSEGAR